MTRDRCFQFLGVRLKRLYKPVFTDDVEALIIEELKKVLQVSENFEGLFMMIR